MLTTAKPAPSTDYSDPICFEVGHQMQMVDHRVATSCVRCGETVRPVLSTFREAFDYYTASGHDQQSALALAQVAMTFA